MEESHMRSNIGRGAIIRILIPPFPGSNPGAPAIDFIEEKAFHP
jgi:hypothetical protein